MSSKFNLTGHWAGVYFQEDRPRPITADLIQDGMRIWGSMRDGQTDMAMSLFEFASKLGLPPGADEQIVANLRQMFPDQPEAPIRYVTSLPPESSLEGTVSGTTIHFLKTYQGDHYGGFEIGDSVVGNRIEHHCVQYRGTLSPDGLAIEGKWWIDPRTETGSRRIDGSFLLRRDPNSVA